MVDDGLPPILCLQSFVKFGPVKNVNTLSQCILDEFADEFQGIGCFTTEHEIRIDPTVRSFIHPARRIPLSMMDKVQNELRVMEDADIIAKVDVPIEWVNSMVVVQKKTAKSEFAWIQKI